MDDAAPPRVDAAAVPAAAIAVVTVCLNPGPLLARAIESVAALGRPDVAHIVIDGASTDGTANDLRSGRYRLACWRSEPDRGIYDAMNTGWAIADADAYVLFLGADDRLLSLPSPSELADARGRGVALIYGDVVIGAKPFRSRFTAELRTANTLHHQALLVRKAAHPAPPFDTRFRVFGDWDFNLRLWKRQVRASYLRSLRSHASPGGVSATRPLGEAFGLVRRHSGVATALIVVVRMMKRKVVAALTDRPAPRR